MIVGNETTSDTQQTPSGKTWGERWREFRHGTGWVPLCLVLILLLGAYFRFTGVDWDRQTHLHPDERSIWGVTLSLQLPKSIGEYFNTAVSPLNPYNQGSSFI